jgi:prevent-host-death family protein
MARNISQRELRNDSGAIMKRVEAGETFVVTSNGRPIAELRPLHRGRSVTAEIALATFAGAETVDFLELRRDLDALIDPYAVFDES